MNEQRSHKPGAGAETTPGEDNVTSKTVQRADSPDDEGTHNPANAWTGQDPPGSEDAGCTTSPTRREDKGGDCCGG